MQSDAYPVPEEYHEYIICKTFGKLPSELDREPARDIYRLLTMMAVESEVQEARRNG